MLSLRIVYDEEKIIINNDLNLCDVFVIPEEMRGTPMAIL